MPQTSSVRSTGFPPRIETGERFAALRDLLTRAHYESGHVCRRLGIETIYDFYALEDRPTAPPSDSLDLLIRLFMQEARVERGVVRALLSAADLETLERFALLTPDGGEAGTYSSTALLYPTGSLVITSDREPAATPTGGSADLVYPAISESTRRFLAALPDTPCENFLELCAGTGIAALGAASRAGHAWAVDISARATDCARFNGLLNRADNFTALQGDLFEAVAGQTFDRICAHPPYMPALEQECLYQDGGPDGEQITRQILAGLPTHLREGGQFYGYCLVTDREDAPAEHRIREMLGDAARELDVAVVVLEGFRPAEYYSLLLSSGGVTAAAVEAHLAVLQRVRARQLIFCWLVIQRHGGPRRAFTVRRQAGMRTCHSEIAWLLAREAAGLEPGWGERLLDARPTASPETHLTVAHQLAEDGWAASQRSLRTEAPFPLTAKCPEWGARFVAACDGATTVRAHLEALKERGVIPGRTTEDVFLASVGVLLAGGFIYIEGLEPPSARSPGRE
jgi:SAM-dependent methyltransferase